MASRGAAKPAMATAVWLQTIMAECSSVRVSAAMRAPLLGVDFIPLSPLCDVCIYLSCIDDPFLSMVSLTVPV